MLKVINIFSIILLLTSVSGCQEEPEYLNYNWFTKFTIEDEEHLIFTNSLDNQHEPYINGYQSYGSVIYPDGTSEITFLTMLSAMSTTSTETDSIMVFRYQIASTNQKLIDLKGKSKEEKLNALISYLKDRRFTETSDDNISILIGDKFGRRYRNKVFSNGTYAVYLDYEINVLDVSVAVHPVEGDVIRVRAKFHATIREDIEYGRDKLLSADIQTYLPLPFE